MTMQVRWGYFSTCVQLLKVRPGLVSDVGVSGQAYRIGCAINQLTCQRLTDPDWLTVSQSVLTDCASSCMIYMILFLSSVCQQNTFAIVDGAFMIHEFVIFFPHFEHCLFGTPSLWPWRQYISTRETAVTSARFGEIITAKLRGRDFASRYKRISFVLQIIISALKSEAHC